MPFPSNEIELAISKAVEPIGALAAEAIGRAVAGTYSTKGALPTEIRQLTSLEEANVVRLAASIEIRAAKAIARLMQEPSFRNVVFKNLAPDRARLLAGERKRIRTTDIAAVVADDPGASLKEIERELERQGKLIEDGEHYRYGSTGKRVRKSTMASKISRLRKELRFK